MPDLCPSLTRARHPVPLFRFLLRTVALGLAALFVAAPAFFPARAEEGARESWQALIEEHQATPEYLIAVDKSRQQLSLFERRSPLKLTRLFTCTTGQAAGDKEREGDLKTPEGVYFVVQRIGSGLEFLKYGTEAYTLNYPNPVDRLRKKTGYGIWIHGRGEPLAPLQTQGCVSLNNEDLASIGVVLQPGTPVALAETFSLGRGENSPEAATISLLEKKVRAWAAAWGQRSTSMFDFYDKEAYSVAQGEPFSRFQAQKERLFRQLPWIRNSVRDIRMLRGPGYWVTWFYQDYKAPNLSTRGVRRLYWVPDAGGNFKIVGMEWAPGMSSGTLLASADPALPPIEARPRTEDQTLSRSETGSEEPAPPHSAQAKGASAEASPSLPPAGAEPGNTPVPADLLAEALAPKQKNFADHVEDPRLGKMAEPPQAARLTAERRAGTGRAEEPLARQTLDLPPPLPSQGLADSGRPVGARVPAPAGPSAPPQAAAAPSAPSQTASAPAAPPRPVAAPASPGTSAASAATTEQDSSGAGGEPRLLASAPPPSRLPEFGPAVPERSNSDGQSLDGTDTTLSEEVRPRERLGSGPALSADGAEASGNAPAALPSAEDTASLLSGRTEAWRAAWESGNLDSYMAFYAPKARQGSRRGAEAIRRHKRDLWNKAAPASVSLEDTRIKIQGATVTVAVRQVYTDSNGRSDNGLKTLFFENINGQWLITQEKWSALPDETGH